MGLSFDRTTGFDQEPTGPPCLALKPWIYRTALALFLAACCAGTAFAQQDEVSAQFLLVSAPASILGVGVADIDLHTAQLLNLKSTAGAEVIAVDHDAPAGKAGMHLRDIIIALNGRQVMSAQQFRETIGALRPHKEVTLAVIRDGKPIKFTIRLADRLKLEEQAYKNHFNPAMPSLGNTFSHVAAGQGVFAGEGPQGRPGDGPNRGVGSSSGDDADDSNQPQAFGFFGLGAELDPIGPQLASFFGVKEGTGMLVKSVEPGSPAAAAGLQAGDVVLKLNDTTIMNPIDWVRAIEAGRGKPMPLTIVRNKHIETLTLPALMRTQALLEWPSP